MAPKPEPTPTFPSAVAVTVPISSLASTVMFPLATASTAPMAPKPEPTPTFPSAVAVTVPISSLASTVMFPLATASTAPMAPSAASISTNADTCGSPARSFQPGAETEPISPSVVSTVTPSSPRATTPPMLFSALIDTLPVGAVAVTLEILPASDESSCG